MEASNKVKVDFIDVGQGDCILLNWIKDDETLGYGIIDCANFERCRYWLELKRIKEIDFILLSHPHSDHFSGMYKLLRYLYEKKIKVKEIFITFSFGVKFLNYYDWTQDDFVENVVYENAKRTELYSFLEEISRRHKDKESVIDMPKERWVYQLNSNLQIRGLGPTAYELTETFIKATMYEKSERLKTKIENDYKNNPTANLLCCCLLIESKKGRVLLTSDITSEEKERLFEKYKKDIRNVVLMQVPHHGSKNGFSSKALDSFEGKNDCVAVISVGPNSYGHPKKEVATYYIDQFKKLYLTSDQDRIKNTYKNKQNAKNNFQELLDLLDFLGYGFVEGNAKDSDYNDGSKSFIVSDDECVLADMEEGL